MLFPNILSILILPAGKFDFLLTFSILDFFSDFNSTCFTFFSNFSSFFFRSSIVSTLNIVFTSIKLYFSVLFKAQAISIDNAYYFKLSYLPMSSRFIVLLLFIFTIEAASDASSCKNNSVSLPTT